MSVCFDEDTAMKKSESFLARSFLSVNRRDYPANARMVSTHRVRAGTGFSTSASYSMTAMPSKPLFSSPATKAGRSSVPSPTTVSCHWPLGSKTKSL